MPVTVSTVWMLLSGWGGDVGDVMCVLYCIF